MMSRFRVPSLSRQSWGWEDPNIDPLDAFMNSPLLSGSEPVLELLQTPGGLKIRPFRLSAQSGCAGEEMRNPEKAGGGLSSERKGRVSKESKKDGKKQRLGARQSTICISRVPKLSMCESQLKTMIRHDTPF